MRGHCLVQALDAPVITDRFNGSCRWSVAHQAFLAGSKRFAYPLLETITLERKYILKMQDAF
jgi:hypothetical protein